MFGIPGKQAVTMTDAAARQIRKLMDAKGHLGLRIGVKKGGCAGMEYTMDYVDELDPHDETVEQGGARILIAPMAQMFLFGTEIDYEVSLLEAGFKFNNPNVEDACGCGESIKFKDVEALAADLGQNGEKG
ncbi:HesB/IscA family protein [Lentibacter sp. XHP0401]|jgi:iron-sulfur cluster assembly protein|uniref:HesB/IscA family protein n=1 Tax=Lentibacter sp. XHP0401 TaxID=2984334 RepID=UPI0021E89D7D|nr:iron-sulfur cluster assembly accessory protein [Lentibacter sp. XHP0401]MCV2891891.1 iron-sulfur cluster assembly accessory protein [Lentibacter sp. XHP0401]